jgi:hypothetical protein
MKRLSVRLLTFILMGSAGSSYASYLMEEERVAKAIPSPAHKRLFSSPRHLLDRQPSRTMKSERRIVLLHGWTDIGRLKFLWKRFRWRNRNF